jgi:hypothetical protein
MLREMQVFECVLLSSYEVAPWLMVWAAGDCNFVCV